MIAGLTMRSNGFMASRPALSERGNLTIPPQRATLQGQAGPKPCAPRCPCPLFCRPPPRNRRPERRYEETI